MTMAQHDQHFIDVKTLVSILIIMALVKNVTLYWFILVEPFCTNFIKKIMISDFCFVLYHHLYIHCITFLTVICCFFMF